MADKIFSTITPSFFQLGVTKMFKILIEYPLYLPKFLVGIAPNLIERWVLGSGTSVRIFVEINAQEGCFRVHLFCMVCCEGRKIRIKFGKFQVPISQKLPGRFLSNLVCKVV